MSLTALSFEIDGDASGVVTAASESEASFAQLTRGMRDLQRAAGLVSEGTELLGTVLGNVAKDAEHFNAEQQALATSLGGSLKNIHVYAEGVAKVLPMVRNGFMAMRTVIPLLGSIALPLLAIAGIEAGLILIIGAVKKAWDADLFGIKEVAHDVFTSIKGFFESIPGWVDTAVRFWVDAFYDMATKLRAMLVTILPAAMAAKIPEIPVPKVLIEKVKFELSEFASNVVDTAVGAWGDVTDTFKTGMGVLKPFVDKLSDAAKMLMALGKGADDAEKAVSTQTDAADDATKSIAKLSEAADDAASEWKQFVPALKHTLGGVELSAAPMVQADVNESLDHFKGALNTGAQILTSRLGEVGNIISSAAQGFSAGGPVGAFIAVIAEIVTRLEGFQLIVDSLNKFLGRSMGRLNTTFGPIFQMIVGLAESIGYLIELINELTGGFRVIGAVLKVVGQTLRFLEIGIMLVVTTVMSAMVKFGRSIGLNMDGMAKTLNDLNLQLVKTMAAHKEWDFFDKQAGPADASVGKKKNPGLLDNTAAVDDNTKANEDMAAAARDATEALTNVPSGYKVAVARFAAMQADHDQFGRPLDIPHMAAGGIVTAPTLALIGEAGPEAVVPLGGGGGGGGMGGIQINNLTIVTNDPVGALKQLRRDAFIKTGATSAAAPQWVHG